MPSPVRLRSSSDIREVFAARSAGGADHVVTHARRRDDGAPARVAVVAGRRVGGAVVRNRAKRRIRACLQSCELPVGVDLVVSGKAGADRVDFPALQAEVASSVRRAVRRSSAG